MTDKMTREEAREILTHNWTRVDNPNYSESELDEAFFMAIEALHTEVVLCKDCKWRKINRKSGTLNCGHEYGMITAKDDNFCNYGERREP